MIGFILISLVNTFQVLTTIKYSFRMSTKTLQKKLLPKLS